MAESSKLVHAEREFIRKIQIEVFKLGLDPQHFGILEECEHFLIYLSIYKFPALSCTITSHNQRGFVLAYMKLYTKWWHTVIKVWFILWDCFNLRKIFDVWTYLSQTSSTAWTHRTQNSGKSLSAAMKNWEQTLVLFGTIQHRCWAVLDRFPAILEWQGVVMSLKNDKE